MMIPKHSILWSALSLILFSFACKREPSDRSGPGAEGQRFVLIESRKPGDVAMTADTPGGQTILPGAELVVGESLQWIDGGNHPAWETETSIDRPPGAGDPIFGDVFHNLAEPVETNAETYSAGGQRIGTAHVIDSRIRLVSAPEGSPVHIFEKSLTKSDAKLFETRLRELGFDPGEVDGVIDSGSRAAVGRYLDSKGLAYRFQNPAISDALFREVTGREPES